jgi:hypothetical protein
MDHVEAAPEGLGVGDLDRRQRTAPEVGGDGEVRQEGEAEPALHHALGRLDGLDLQGHVRHQTGAAEKPVGERPVARASIEEHEGSTRSAAGTSPARRS